MLKAKITIFSMLLVAAFSTTSCEKITDETPQDPNLVKNAILESMREWYYWNDQLPSVVNVNSYGTNDELLYNLMYVELDRWSYLTTKKDFNDAFTGQNVGHGFGFGLNDSDELFVSFVYDDSPAGKDGWQRGWQIIEVNGKPIASYRVEGGYNFNLGDNLPGISNTFTFKLPDGSTTSRTNIKNDYQANSVLHKEIIEEGNKKIGYWVYNSFKATANLMPTKSLEVEEALNYFESENIDELILDLRYNGGGSVDVAEQIMNALVPSQANGKLMYTNAFNTEKDNLNELYNFEKSNNIDLEKLVVITSRGSASSSELVINCLKPYMEVVLIGETTYGKPVGSFPLSSFNETLDQNNVELVPITFAISNASGEAEYYDGFPVDIEASEDSFVNWGNLDDDRLSTALSFILNGSLNATSRLKSYKQKWQMIDGFTGLQKEFPAY
ncbi:S41 family peptidase [uncultured Cyclobacterium sp.]|uniref:S41 family peptidase n=1 Tax=uncultured Cyclobacterium sp. TaxID=453820 RepID=UPI0030EDB2EC|tara:strand:- start:100904 stop:102229 length:1326 start_codon:yes stop_codon:yes gene_type:complete